MANGLTVAALKAQRSGKLGWLTDGGARGAGKLRALRGKFYFQYFDSGGRRRFLPIGPFDESGANSFRELRDGERGYTLAAARDRAAQLSMMYRDGLLDLHEHFRREREAHERAHKAEDAARRAAEEAAQRSTLRQLLDAYITHLERSGKQATADAKSIFVKHVIKAAPDLADKRAADVSVDDFVTLIAKLTEAGKGRTAAKLRSYLRAAYSLAIRSKTDPSAPLALQTFGIATNPLASIASLSQFNRSRARNLSAVELRALLNRLDGVEAGVKKDAVLLALLLGGQRPAQLLRVRPADADMPAETITLYDQKGKRKEPRRHVLPLTKQALAIVRRRLDELPEEAQYLFTSDGRTAMRPETASAVVADISAAMVKAKEAREPFQLRDLRKTCETMLAALGVSSDVRAMILSHGLGGVQKRHYDFHDYALEMREALTRWAQHLDRVKAGQSADVVPMKRRKRAS